MVTIKYRNVAYLSTHTVYQFKVRKKIMGGGGGGIWLWKIDTRKHNFHEIL